MFAFRNRFITFLRSEDGPTATEYAVLLAVICIGVISALSQFGDHMGNIYTSIDGTMPGAGGS